MLDLKGSAQCVLFPEAYETHRGSIETDGVLLLRGTVSHGRGTAVHVQEVIPIEEAARRLVQSIVITG